MLKVWNVSPDRRAPSRWRCSAPSSSAPASCSRSTPSATRPSAPTPRPDRGRPDRLDAADRLAARRPALREADRLAGLARGGLPRQQPAAGRARRGDLLGHLLPADLGALHRRARPRWRRPGSTATRRRWRSCSSSSPGSGRCSPGGGSAWARRGGSSGRPRWSRLRSVVGLLVAASPTPRSQPLALVLFAFAAFALAALAQEFWRGAAATARSPGGSYCAGARRRCSPATAAATAATSSTRASRSC